MAGKMCVGHIPQQFFTGAFKLASLPPKDSRGNHARILCHMPVPWHTHTRLTALFPGLPGWASTRKVKPILTLLEQETVSGSGISWAICKSAPRSRQITTPAPHHSFFYRPDALPAAQPTASKHWRPSTEGRSLFIIPKFNPYSMIPVIQWRMFAGGGQKL